MMTIPDRYIMLDEIIFTIEQWKKLGLVPTNKTQGTFSYSFSFDLTTQFVVGLVALGASKSSPWPTTPDTPSSAAAG